MLEGMVQSFRRLRPGIKITVLSANPSRTSREHGVRAISRLNIWAIKEEIARSSLLISGGGSLLQDVTGAFNIPYYLWIISLAMALKKPVMLYGQGIGPVRGRLGRFLMEGVLNRVDLITVRDEASQQELRELGITQPPIQVTADPVFALYPFLGKEIRRPEDADQPPAGKIALSVRRWPGRGFIEALARAADHLIEETGYSVIFLPMQYPDDIEAARQVALLMRHQSEIVTRRLDFRQALTMISQTELMIGMRLHALVFAALAGVPLVGLSYDPKIDGFLARLGLAPAGPVAEIRAEDILIRAEEALHNREAIRQELLARSEVLSREALRNTELALGLLPG